MPIIDPFDNYQRSEIIDPFDVQKVDALDNTPASEIYNPDQPLGTIDRTVLGAFGEPATDLLLGQRKRASGFYKDLANSTKILDWASKNIQDTASMPLDPELPSGVELNQNDSMKIAEKWFRGQADKLMPTSEEMVNRDSFGNLLYQAIGETPIAISEYVLANMIAGGNPVAGMAMVDAIGEADKGMKATVVGGVKGALMGTILHAIQPLQRLLRAATMGTIGGVQTAATGGSPKEVAVNLLTMGGLGAIGGPGEVGLKDITQNFIKGGLEKADTLDAYVRNKVEGYLKEGKKVDPALMENYPDLKEKYAAKPEGVSAPAPAEKAPESAVGTKDRIVGENYPSEVIHGTTQTSAKAFIEGKEPQKTQRTLSEFGEGVIYTSEFDNPHQAIMYGVHGGTGHGGRTLISLRLKDGTRVLDVATEAKRIPAISPGRKNRYAIEFKDRPSWTDDMAKWLDESRVENGKSPLGFEKALSFVDPTSSGFHYSSYPNFLVGYAKNRGYGAIRFADETIIINKSVVESSRKISTTERKAILEAKGTYPRDGLYAKDFETVTLEKSPAIEPGGAKQPWEMRRGNVDSALDARRVKGDAKLDTMDLADELADKGAEISDDGYVTLYHRTTKANAEKMIKTGQVISKEDRIFFGTHPEGQIEGYGDAVIKTKLPLEKLELSDVFTGEAHVSLKSGRPGTSVKIKSELWEPTPKPQPTAPAKPAPTEPHLMTRDEFAEAFWFHGKGQGHPLFGKPKITGGVTKSFKTAAAYAEKENGTVDLIRTEDLPIGAKDYIKESEAERGGKVDQISAMGIEPGKAEFTIPANTEDPQAYFIKQALSNGKLTPTEAIRIHKGAYPDIETWPEMKPEAPGQEAAGANPFFTKEDGTILQAVPLPGLKEFVEQDLTPATKSFIQGAAETFRTLKNGLFPRKSASREAVDLIHTKLGEMNAFDFQNELTFKELINTFDKVTDGENIIIIDKIKKGESTDSPELDKAIELYREIDAEIGRQLQEINPSLPLMENHFRSMWKVIPGSERKGFMGLFRKPLEGSKGMLKRHTLDTFSEGIAMGGVPYSYNWVRMALASWGDAMKYISTNRMWEGLKEIGEVKFVRFGQKSPEGFVRLNDKIARVLVPVSKYGKFVEKHTLSVETQSKISATEKILRETMSELGKDSTAESRAGGKIEVKVKEALTSRGWSEGEAVQMIDRIKNQKSDETKNTLLEKVIEKTINKEVETIVHERTVREFKPGKGLVNVGEYHIAEGAGRLLNRYLSRDMVREVAVGRGLLAIKNITTAMELSLSAFHFTFESLETIASTGGLGFRKMSSGITSGNLEHFLEGAKEVLPWNVLASPYTAARTGGSAIRYLENPAEFIKTTRGEAFIKKYPEAKRLIADLFTGGGKLAIHQDYKINFIQTFQGAIANKNYPGAFLRALPAFSEVIMKPLFETYIPRLKVGMFLKEYSNALVERSADLSSGKTTRAEMSRRTWDFVEDRLGEMNFDNLFWDRTFKSSMQILVRSVTWKLGNIRGMGKAFIEQANEFKVAYDKGRIPELAPEMAWALGVIGTHVLIGSLANRAFTGEWPQSWKDMIYPKIDKDGNRISIPTYLRDWFHAWHSPAGWAKSSASGIISRLIEVYHNKDFYGTEVYNPEESYTKNAVDSVIHMVPLPFSITSQRAMFQKGEPMGKQVSGYLGFPKAPFYIEQSAALQKAYELMGQNVPAKPRTKEEFARAQLIKQYSNKYEKALNAKDQVKMQEVTDAFSKDVQSGKLYVSDVDRFTKRVGKDPLDTVFRKLDLRDQISVWNEADNKEKLLLANIFLDKLFRLAGDDPQKYMAMKDKIQPVLDEIQRGTIR